MFLPCFADYRWIAPLAAHRIRSGSGDRRAHDFGDALLGGFVDAVEVPGRGHQCPGGAPGGAQRHLLGE